MSPRYYIRHQTLAEEEDVTHEFKAHRVLSKSEISDRKFWPNRLDGGQHTWEKKPRYCSPVSKAICGMLNTGKDILERYRPSVPKSMYSFKFVPVIDGDETDAAAALRREPPPQPMTTEFERDLEHELRVPRYCWCDMYALSALQHGIVHRFYVIEVTLAPWNPAATDAAPLADAAAPGMWPVFQNEDGDVFLRRNASTDRISMRSVEQMTEQAVRRLSQGAASSVRGFGSGGNQTILGKCEVESERQSAAAGEDSSEDSFLSYDEEEYAKDAYC